MRNVINPPKKETNTEIGLNMKSVVKSPSTVKNVEKSFRIVPKSKTGRSSACSMVRDNVSVGRK